MSDINSPYTVNRSDLSSGYYIPRDYISGTTFSAPDYVVNANPTHSIWGGLGYGTAYYNYPILSSGSLGWYLRQTAEYTFTGSTGVCIVSNGYGAILNFDTSGGNLYLSDNDTVSVKATGGIVTVLSSSSTLLHNGTINAVSGGVDQFDINTSHGISLNAKDGADKITVTSGSNTVHGDDSDDNITVNGNSNYVYGDNGQDKITVNSSNNHIYGGNDKDSITVIGGSNYVDAGADADYVTVSSQHNTILGGANSGVKDTIIVSSTTSGGADYNTVYGGGNGYHSPDTNDDEDLITVANHSYVQGDNKGDTITATDSNIIYGDSTEHDGDSLSGADVITARNSNKIYGGDGTDHIMAQRSNLIKGNNGVDTVEADDYNTVYGGGAGDSIKVSEYNLVYGGTTYGGVQGD